MTPVRGTPQRTPDGVAGRASLVSPGVASMQIWLSFSPKSDPSPNPILEPDTCILCCSPTLSRTRIGRPKRFAENNCHSTTTVRDSRQNDDVYMHASGLEVVLLTVFLSQDLILVSHAYRWGQWHSFRQSDMCCEHACVSQSARPCLTA